MKGNFVYGFLIKIDFLNTRSGLSYFLLANQNTHLTAHEPIKIRVIKVKIKLKFVASASERHVNLAEKYQKFGEN